MKVNMNKMKAMVATGYGTSEVLELQMVQRPQPGSGDLLIRVHSSAATTADSMMLTGKPYIARLFLGWNKPKKSIPGTGFAGVVEEVGAEVNNFKIGDRVFGGTTFGFSANAEYVVIKAEGYVLPMPEQLGFGEAATFTDGHITSLNFLKEIAKVKPGERVLINGASGSLGTAAVQLAKAMGAEVTGVCSTQNIGLVKSLGAEHVVDYTQTDFTRNGERYDVIYDTIGKSSFGKCRKALVEGGQYISPVGKLSLLLQMLWTSLVGGKKAKFAATGMRKEGDLRRMLGDLIRFYKAGKLKTVIDRQYPLEKLAEAHTYIAQGRKRGNVVIVMGE